MPQASQIQLDVKQSTGKMFLFNQLCTMPSRCMVSGGTDPGILNLGIK
jgi:hypothetical protein